jgi:CRP-like cAMP-binding protein
MTIDPEFLKSVPYFSGLGPAEIESLRYYMFERSAQEGDLVLLEDEPADSMYIVASGVVKVFRTSSEGKEQILYFVRPGQSLNDVPAYDGGPNVASVQALRSVTLYGIRYSDLESILREHPGLYENVTRLMAGQVRHLVSLVEDLSFRHVIARVAKILLEYASDGTGPNPRLTQQEMAAMAGTAREVVGRSLRSLEDEGAIRMERHRIVIADKEALRGVAEA